MSEINKKYYPTVLQAIHLLILYIFIQSLVDFPMAMIDYYKDTEYLYHPIKKIALGVGSTIFILIYGFKKSKGLLFDVFPVKFFNPLIIIPIISFLWAAHHLLEIPSALLDKYLPAPAWFWEMFNKIFEGDFGWWGAFMKVAVVAPIVEELIFRGLILNGFRRNYNAVTAVFMSALLFALFHLNPWQFPATFVLGLLLGWIMLRTNNILLAILGHSINNFLVLLSLTYWEDIRSHAFYLMGKGTVYLTSFLVVLLSLLLIFLFSSKLVKRKKQT
jgi:membrane protease YdiL (CAAX protease family)